MGRSIAGRENSRGTTLRCSAYLSPEEKTRVLTTGCACPESETGNVGRARGCRVLGARVSLSSAPKGTVKPPSDLIKQVF